MKFLHATPSNENSRYIYFGGSEMFGNNFEQKDAAPQNSESEISDSDYQKLLTYYEQNPDELQQLIENDSDQTEDYNTLVAQELNIAGRGDGKDASCRRARRNSPFRAKANKRTKRGNFKPKTKGRTKAKKSKAKFAKLNNGRGGYL